VIHHHDEPPRGGREIDQVGDDKRLKRPDQSPNLSNGSVEIPDFGRLERLSRQGFSIGLI
jgi:hypothetical protein